MYDPFEAGSERFRIEEGSAVDAARDRRFALCVWRPFEDTLNPLILFSHFSGGDRHASTFLCEHLASHGYVVASIDHSDKHLPRPSESNDPLEKNARMQAWIDARVPDMRFLLHTVSNSATLPVGIVGHSFGGWTALAAPSQESRIAAVVALAPAGAIRPRPGVIKAQLDFDWQRDVPTLVVGGDSDISIPVDRVRDVFERIPSRKKLVILHGVDHLHFVDQAQEQHERVRGMAFPPELSWLQEEMRPFAQLRPESEAHRIVAGLTLAHFDATLKEDEDARRFIERCPDVM